MIAPTAPTEEQQQMWLGVLTKYSNEHQHISHDYQTARQRAVWANDDWHCICGEWGSHGLRGYASHLEFVLRRRDVP